MTRIKYILIFSLLVGCSTAYKPAQIPETSRQIVPIVENPIPRTIRISAVGDIMMGNTATPYLEQYGYHYPFAATSHIYKDSDIVIGNLETSLTNKNNLYVKKKYRFRNPPEKVASALKAAGFNIVSLANNHSLDYGAEGLKDTISTLNSHDILYHGAGMDIHEARKPIIISLADGTKAGFLAYSNTYPSEFWAKENNPGTAFGHEHHIKADVNALKNLAEIVVVSFHWGQEGSRKLRHYQPLLAHAAIDEGADLVIGHHPHILQAVEYYKDGLILYSLGNYVFGSFSNRVFSSVIANIEFKSGKFYKLDMVPININNFQIYFQPQILTGEPAKQVFEDIYKQSLLRNTKLQFNNEKIQFSTTSSMQIKRN